MYPPNLDLSVIDYNEHCSPVKALQYPLSVSLLRYISRASRVYPLVHSELTYSLGCLRTNVRFGIHRHGVTDIRLMNPASGLDVLKAPYIRALEGADYVRVSRSGCRCHEEA